jgi:hypothetical protein
VRTTLTLDDEVAQQLTRLAHSRETSLEAIVNEALRHGLDSMTRPTEPRPFHTRAESMGSFRGVDPARLGQVDDLAGDLARMGDGHDSG